MKSILTILFILIVGTTFSQKKLTAQDSAKIAAATPVLSENDLEQILIFLDDKLYAKDHRLVLNTIKEAINRKKKKQ
jgi:predicted lipase